MDAYGFDRGTVSLAKLSTDYEEMRDDIKLSVWASGITGFVNAMYYTAATAFVWSMVCESWEKCAQIHKWLLKQWGVVIAAVYVVNLLITTLLGISVTPMFWIFDLIESAMCLVFVCIYCR